MDAFERAQRVAVRAMRTRMWQKAIGEEDPMMVAHIPQLVRINKLGMITTQSQSGVVRHYKSVRTGERRTMAERAFCYGFVRESVAGQDHPVDVGAHRQVRRASVHRRGRQPRLRTARRHDAGRG